MLQIDILNVLPSDLRNLILRVLFGLLALLLIWLLRRGLSRILLLPFRRLAERSSARLDTVLVRVLEMPVRLLIIALGISIAGQIVLTDEGSTAFVSNLSRSFVILAVIVGLYNAVDLIIQSSLRLRSVTGLSIDDQLLPFMRTALKVVIVAIGVVIILQEWDYDVNGLVAGLGLGGLAFSLAAQDTVANLFAFTTIVSDRPFVVGEYIVTPDVEGTVEEVGSRNVRVRRRDQAYVTIPNARVASAPIVNWSRLNRRQIDFKLGLTYSTDSRQMRAVLEEIRAMLKAYEKADPDSIVVYFNEFGDSSLNILIRANIWEADWTAFQADREAVNLQLMEIVEQAGLSIAFPTRSLYIENVPQANSGAAQPDEDV